MDESEERAPGPGDAQRERAPESGDAQQERAPRDEAPQQERTPRDEAPQQGGEPRGPEDPNNRRPRRRGRRGRGSGAPFRGPTPGGQPFRAPFPGGQPFRGGRPQSFRPQQPFGQPQASRQQQGFRPQQAPRGPIEPGGVRPGREDDEGNSQLREIGAYERRQQAQQQRRTGWRPPTSGGSSWRQPSGPPAGGGWRGGGGAGRRPFGGGQSYSETVRRVTAGPRAAAPSHDAGEPIAGPHAVIEAIRSGRGIRKLYVSQDRGTRTGAVNELITEAQEKRIFVNFVDKLEIARLSPIEEHQGVVAIVEGRAGVELDELLLHLDTVSEAPLVLVIDSLQDPQNFGVLLRSAEGAGVEGVVIPRHRSVGLTAAVAKTSAGASEHLLVADVVNLRQAIDALKEKGIWAVGADETGDLLYDEVDYRGPTAIVIGGEGEGIRRLVLEGCDQVVRIPMEGQVSSLNAAAAGTVILYEALRQRRRDVAPPETRTPRPEPVATAPSDDVEAARDAEQEQIEEEAFEAEGERDDAPLAAADQPEELAAVKKAEPKKRAPRKTATRKKTTEG